MKKTWEELFDKQFVADDMLMHDKYAADDIKSFISQHFIEKSELREMVKGMKWNNKDANQFWHELEDTNNPFTDMKECYNLALGEILQRIK